MVTRFILVLAATLLVVHSLPPARRRGDDEDRTEKLLVSEYQNFSLGFHYSFPNFQRPYFICLTLLLFKFSADIYEKVWLW